jgi:hypothetical protein
MDLEVAVPVVVEEAHFAVPTLAILAVEQVEQEVGQ